MMCVVVTVMVRQTLMIEAVVEDVGDDDGEYCLEDGGEGGGGKNTYKDVCKIGWL